MITALAVATRIIANPVSNVFQKRLADATAHPLFIITATHALLTIMALPLLAGVHLTSLTADFWINMAVSAMLAIVGNSLLVFALRFGDLSVLGSINAYKAILSLVLGIFLIGEIPSAAGLAGGVVVPVWSHFLVGLGGRAGGGGGVVVFFFAGGGREPVPGR